ncbi:MAG: hypothetical protein R2714_17245 [Microthrixaceae bacterium]
MSKAQILDHVWQYDFVCDGGVVETYIDLPQEGRRRHSEVDPHDPGRGVHPARQVGMA